jgi:16S rRNA processing protein RimM
MSPSSSDKRLCVGQIVGVHGVRGAVKIKSFTADPEALVTYGALSDGSGTRSFEVTLKSAHKDVLIAGITDVTTRNEAEVLARAKTKLFIERTQLPKLKKGQFYLQDLVGFTAQEASGKKVGEVKAIVNYGGGDILVIHDEAGKECLLPLKAPFAEKPDVKNQTIQVFVPEGWDQSTAKKPKEAPKEAEE